MPPYNNNTYRLAVSNKTKETNKPLPKPAKSTGGEGGYYTKCGTGGDRKSFRNF